MTDREEEAPAADPVSLRLDDLYLHAGGLEDEFAALARRQQGALTVDLVSQFNMILREARSLVPNSKALREDVDLIGRETRPADAYHALHVTIVPTLHNALPEELYRQH